MTRMAAVFTLLSCMASASVLAAPDCPFPQGMQASIGASKQAIAARQAGFLSNRLGRLVSVTEGSYRPKADGR